MAGISSDSREPDAMKVARPDLNGRGEVVTLPPTQPMQSSFSQLGAELAYLILTTI